jgi:hypothetical protein
MTLNSTSGDPNAESYAAVADADSYWTARGDSVWPAAADSDKEVALRKATAYLDDAYRGRWIGIVTNAGEPAVGTTPGVPGQALSWPRAEGSRYRLRPTFLLPLQDAIEGVFIGQQQIPAQLVKATCEAARLVLTGTILEPTLIRGNAIKSVSSSLGPLKKETVYQDGAPSIDRYTAIEGLLKGITVSQPGASFGVVRIVRG